jgi:hypothetical protein
MNPQDQLRQLRHAELQARALRQMVGPGSLGGRSALVAPLRGSRRNLSDQPHPMQEGGGGGGGGSMTIDLGEAGPNTGYSRILYPMLTGTLDSVRGALAVAGSTDTIAEVVRWDGAVANSVATITIPATALTAVATVAEPFLDTEGWQMRVTQVGTGAQGLSYNGKFS